MLDVQIPAKAFEQISVEGISTNIDIVSSVNANNIAAKSKSENIDVSATFQNLTIECKSGNVDSFLHKILFFLLISINFYLFFALLL